MPKRRRRIRTLAERDVPATNWYPGLYGPAPEYREGPLTPRQKAVWNFVIGGVLVGGVLLMVLAAVFHWGG
jgi:hypothetical protein